MAAIVTVTLSSSSTMRTLGGVSGRTSDRQRHAEHGPTARPVAHLQPAAVALGDAEAYPEPETGALLALGREERLEDVREVLLCDTRTGVRYLDPDGIRADE